MMKGRKITVDITNIQKHQTEEGQEMVFIEILNRYTVIVSPILYRQVKNLLSVGATINLTGRMVQGKILASEITA